MCLRYTRGIPDISMQSLYTKREYLSGNEKKLKIPIQYRVPGIQ